MLHYDDGYEQTAALLLSSDLPATFVEDCLTNREAMHKLCEQGYAAAEVLIHLRKQYRLEKEAEAERIRRVTVEEAERRRREAAEEAKRQKQTEMEKAERTTRFSQEQRAQREAKLEDLRTRKRYLEYLALQSGFNPDEPMELAVVVIVSGLFALIVTGALVFLIALLLGAVGQ